MPKTRLQKEEILAKTVDRLSRASSIVLVNPQGVKVGEMENMRDALFAQGLQLQIAKNSLLKLALAQTGIELPEELLDQPLALIYSYEEPIAAAKLASNFLKDIETLKLQGGVMNRVYLSASEVEVLAKLPGRDQLLAQLVGTLAAPLNGFVNVLAGNLRGLVTVLNGVCEAKTS